MTRTIQLSVFLLIVATSVSAQSNPAVPEDCTEAKALASRLQLRFSDWPALSRYRDANSAVQPPAKDEARVVFMGDSITDGWKLANYFPNKPYINRGISGEHTPQILCRFRPDVIALKPRVVVILAGTNDIKFANFHDVAGITRPSTFQVITDNLVSMAELARANNILVVFALLLPVSDYDKEKDGKQIINTDLRPPAQIKTLNDWIKAYAARSGHTYLDYHSAMRDEKGFLRDELSDDGLHPNDNGYAVMAPLAEHAIATAQKSKR